jgi:Lipocalin-like domain/CrtC N-terminal lipocalin domain
MRLRCPPNLSASPAITARILNCAPNGGISPAMLMLAQPRSRASLAFKSLSSARALMPRKPCNRASPPSNCSSLTPRSQTSPHKNTGTTNASHAQALALKRNADGSYTSRIPARDFTLDLQFTPTQALLLQGNQGLSRKGPEEKQASYYYSQPQLHTTGSITHSGKQQMIPSGIAWLDHEWSNEILHPEAMGWDWIGMNLFDGSSLTAFQLRRADGTALWAGGSFRHASGASPTIFAPSDVRFQAGNTWQSPSSRARYPVLWRISTPQGSYTVQALMPAQELDSRSSIGTIYWEGLADLLDTQGALVGRGYLEMTGYAGRLPI